MKRIIITLLALLTLSFYSCNILTEDPKDFVSPQNFFKTEDEVTSALYGVYEKLHNIYIGDYEKIFIGDIGVDIMITRQSPRIDVYQYYLLEAPTVEYSTMWKDHYSAIGAANMVINRINASSNLKEEFKNKIIGEVRFLRAFFYYRFLSVRLNRLKNKLLANYLRNRGNDLATVRNSAFCVAILSNNSFICKYNIFFRKYELSVAIL